MEDYFGWQYGVMQPYEDLLNAVILLLLFRFTSGVIGTALAPGFKPAWKRNLHRPILAALFLPPYHLEANGGTFVSLCKFVSVQGAVVKLRKQE